jgi:hypothetical protein
MTSLVIIVTWMFEYLGHGENALARSNAVERVTRIELAWQAWKTRTERLWLGRFLTCKEKG